MFNKWATVGKDEHFEQLCTKAMNNQFDRVHCRKRLAVFFLSLVFSDSTDTQLRVSSGTKIIKSLN